MPSKKADPLFSDAANDFRPKHGETISTPDALDGGVPYQQGIGPPETGLIRTHGAYSPKSKVRNRPTGVRQRFKTAHVLSSDEEYVNMPRTLQLRGHLC